MEKAELHLVVGLGKTGQSVLRHLQRLNVPAIAWDTRATLANLSELQAEFAQVPMYVGELPSEVLAQARVVVVSPGVPLARPELQQARQQGLRLIGDIDLWRQAVQAPIVAITGSNAKSTVTSMVGEIAKQANWSVAVAGNVGTPVLDQLAQQPDADLWVVELSSFQLETTHALNASVATVLNLSADHMDRYASLADYCQAKHRIFTGAQHVVVNVNDANSRPSDSGAQFISEFSIHAQPSSAWRLDRLQGQDWLYQGRRPFMAASEMALSGKQNIENALASAALASAVQIPEAAILAGLRTFSGLPHRCQVIADGAVKWVNDSKGTNVGATVAALTGLACGQNIILLVGGEGKGADFAPLADAMRERCKAVIGFGKDGEQIAALFPNGQVVSTLAQAVDVAKQLAVTGDVVLLSPACASFDQFNSFEHRGEHFMQLVEAQL